jgi:hypothetical protein
VRKPWAAATAPLTEAIGTVLAPLANALRAKPRHVCSDRCDCGRKAAINGRRGRRGPRWIDADRDWLHGGRRRGGDW